MEYLSIWYRGFMVVPIPWSGIGENPLVSMGVGWSGVENNAMLDGREEGSGAKAAAPAKRVVKRMLLERIVMMMHR